MTITPMHNQSLLGLQELPQFNPSDISPLTSDNIIAQTANATTYRCTYREAPVVVKVMHGKAYTTRDLAFIYQFTQSEFVAQILGYYLAFVDERGSAASLCTVMPLYDCNLAQFIKEFPLKTPVALHILKKVAMGMLTLHHAGFEHKNLKPSNIMLSKLHTLEPEVRISDFGFAKDLDSSARVLASSHAYLAPEFWNGQKCDKASDVYAFGVIMQEMRESMGSIAALDKLASRCTSRHAGDRPRFEEIFLCLSQVHHETISQKSCLVPCSVTSQTIPALETGIGVASASSEYDSNHLAANCRMFLPKSRTFSHAWCAGANDTSQWLQVSFTGKAYNVQRIQIQGRSDCEQWVSKFRISFWNGEKWERYKIGGSKDFDGCTSRQSIVTVELPEPVRTIAVRIHPVEWVGHVSMRCEVHVQKE